MIKKYKSKPHTVEMMIWTGNNNEEMLVFVGKHGFIGKHQYPHEHSPLVDTLFIRVGGTKIKANIGDYIVKGGCTEIVIPYKPESFFISYEELSNE